MKRDKVFIYENGSAYLKNTALKHGLTLTPTNMSEPFNENEREFHRILSGIEEADFVLVDLSRESEAAGYVVGYACARSWAGAIRTCTIDSTRRRKSSEEIRTPDKSATASITRCISFETKRHSFALSSAFRIQLRRSSQ